MSNWIEPEFEVCYKKIKEVVRAEWKGAIPRAWFTPHSVQHNEAVERNAIALCEPAFHSLAYPTPLERFLLSASAWLHDMGMCPRVFYSSPHLDDCGDDKGKKEDAARSSHHLISADYIKGEEKQYLFEVEELLKANPSAAEEIATSVSIIASFHRRSEDILCCPGFRNVGGSMVRIQLLAALLRLADGIHISADRCTNIEYQLMMMAPMPWESQFHWLKSFALSRISTDCTNRNLHIQIDIPRSSGPAKQEWRKISQRLAEHIRLEIAEELDDVNKVLVLHPSFPTFWSITYDIQEVPGYDPLREKQLWDVLHNKEIAISPNAGRVFAAALDTINGVVNSPRLSPSDKAKTLLDFKTRFLDRLLHDRPCHVALGRLQLMLCSVLSGPDVVTIQASRQIDDLKQRIERIRSHMVNMNGSTLKGVNADFLKGARYVFVFAYSSTVANLLSLLPTQTKGNLMLYVAECRPKSRYTSGNRPLYLDGFEYAKMLRERGMLRITIIPDLEVATLIQRLNEDEKKRALVMFGANGVQATTGLFGYSAGHLMIAVTAREMGIPIWVVSESLKIGNFKPDQELRRGHEWFSTYGPTLSELEANAISIENFREDTIPYDSLDLLITEKGTLNLRQEKQQVINQLLRWSAEWDQVFGIKST